MKKLTVLLSIIFLSITLNAQQKWQKVDSVFAPNGIAAKSFSSPFMADLNGDGKLDLVLGSSDDKIDFFYNAGTFQNPYFIKDTSVMSSIYANGSQYTNSSYPVFADLNGDGKLDLIIGGFNGLLYYVNVGTAQKPQWQQDTTVFASLNQVVGNDPKPAFVDIDGDGDLDLFVGAGESIISGPDAGLTLAFRNTGTKTNPVFVQDLTLTTGFTDMGYNSYPTFADMDGDGDYDVLFGRDLASFVYYNNKGTAAAPKWSMYTQVFNTIEGATYWKNPCLIDMDGDSLIDLVYGTSSGMLYAYHNTGTKAAPKFTLLPNYFNIVKGSSASTIALGDIDNNGTIDLISGSAVGDLQFFKNSGTKQTPLFQSAASSITSISPGSYTSPALVDIDGDGDLDLVVGALNGNLYCYLNNNGTFTENKTIFNGISVGGFSAPAFGDINGDGLPDMLLGAETSSDVNFYLNNGNGFTADNSFIQGISFPSSCKPAFVDVDGDGDLDLVLGDSFGDIIYYENTGTAKAPVWTKNTTLFDGISVTQSSSPAFADIDGDGRPDLVLGEYNGNFTFYKNLFAKPTAVKNTTKTIAKNYNLDQNYPNPFNPSTTIKYSVPVNSFVTLKVFDVLGNEVKTLVNNNVAAGDHTVTFNAAGLSSGTYFYQLKSGNALLTKKFMLLK